MLGFGLRYVAHRLGNGGPDLEAYLVQMCNWDCNWYADLARGGYWAAPNDLGEANWAFFPMTAIGIWLIQTILPVSGAAAGTILGMGCTIATALVVTPLLPNRTALWLFRLFILAGPFSYAYATGMSEPVFMLLTVLAFAGLAERNYLLVAIAGAVMTATRVTGIFITIPIAMHVLHLLATESDGSLWKRLRSAAWSIAALLVVPAGVAALMLHLHLRIGDALAFVHVQSAWSRELGNPIATILYSLNPGQVSGATFGMAVATVVGLAAAIGLAFRRRWGMAAFVAVSLLASASMGLPSMMRFVIGLAPVTILAAEWLGEGRIRTWVAVLFALAACIPLAMFWMGGNVLFA